MASTKEGRILGFTDGSEEITWKVPSEDAPYVANPLKTKPLNQINNPELFYVADSLCKGVPRAIIKKNLISYLEISPADPDQRIQIYRRMLGTPETLTQKAVPNRKQKTRYLQYDQKTKNRFRHPDVINKISGTKGLAQRFVFMYDYALDLLLANGVYHTTRGESYDRLAKIWSEEDFIPDEFLFGINTPYIEAARAEPTCNVEVFADAVDKLKREEKFLTVDFRTLDAKVVGEELQEWHKRGCVVFTEEEEDALRKFIQTYVVKKMGEDADEKKTLNITTNPEPPKDYKAGEANKLMLIGKTGIDRIMKAVATGYPTEVLLLAIGIEKDSVKKYRVRVLLPEVTMRCAYQVLSTEEEVVKESSIATFERGFLGDLEVSAPSLLKHLKLGNTLILSYPDGHDYKFDLAMIKSKNIKNVKQILIPCLGARYITPDSYCTRGRLTINIPDVVVVSEEESDTEGEAPQGDPLGGEAPQDDPLGGEAPQDDPLGGEAPQDDPLGGDVPQDDPLGGEVPQDDDPLEEDASTPVDRSDSESSQSSSDWSSGTEDLPDVDFTPKPSPLRLCVVIPTIA